MILTVRKQTIISILATAITFIFLFVMFVGGNLSEAFAVKKKLPIYSVETSEQKVALSFDAAWGADKTEEILKILGKYNVKATFFLVGFWVDKYPDMVKKIFDNGHLIGNHSTNHLHANKLSKEEIANEIDLTNIKLKQIINEDIKYFRAPFGEYNDRLIEHIDSSKMQIIQWDVDSLDWKGLSAKQITERVVSKVQKGSVILFHNNSDHIIEALPFILLALQNKGLKGVRMDELIYKDNYFIDNNGKQILK